MSSPHRSRRTGRTRTRRRFRRVRRLLVLALAGTAAASAVRTRRERARLPEPAVPPSWPPLADTAAPAALEPGAPAPWVDPVDGACPVTHPVKGNRSSGIYHLPGSRHYARTIPERCYRDPDAAEADGMRAPRR